MGIFEPYRAIGCITSSVPFSVQRLGTETFLTVSVGKAFQIFNVSNFSTTRTRFFFFFFFSGYSITILLIELPMNFTLDVQFSLRSVQSSIWFSLVKLLFFLVLPPLLLFNNFGLY